MQNSKVGYCFRVITIEMTFYNTQNDSKNIEGGVSTNANDVLTESIFLEAFHLNIKTIFLQ